MRTPKEELLSAVSKGRVVLFLGAGAIAGSTIGTEKKPALLGKDLASALVKRFFPEEINSIPSLRGVCRDIINNFNRNVLRESLFELLTPVNPSNSLMQIPKIQWAGIYTVNVDDAVERAYENNSQKAQNLVSVVLPDDIAAEDRLKEVSLYKLHGCLLKPESNLIFSHQDYTKSRELNLRLFSSLESNLCEFPFLFVGFGLDDSDFQDLWENVKEYSGGSKRLYPTYLVTPDPKPSFIKSMGVEGIEVINDKAESFFPWLYANLPEIPQTFSERLLERTAPVTKLIQDSYNVTIPPELIDTIKEHCEVVSQIPNLHKDTLKSRYFLGNQPDWGDIQSGLPIRRDIEEDILDLIEEWMKKPKPKFTLLLGAAGYGKTTLLMQLAIHLSKAYRNSLVLWTKRTSHLDPASIADFCKLLQKPIVLFIDDAFRHMSAIRRLKNDAIDHKIPIFILFASRPADWNAAKGPEIVGTPANWKLKRLSLDESFMLARTVRNSGRLAPSKLMLTDIELRDHFYQEAEQHILAGLLTIMSESQASFKQIIADEFYRIKIEDARRLYLSIAMVHAIGAPIPAMLAVRMINIPLVEYHKTFYPFLEETVLELQDARSGDLMFTTQHRVIAETLIHEVLPVEKSVELILSIVNNIDPHNIHQYTILRQMYHEDYLIDILKAPGPIRSCYEALIEYFPSDPFIKQHYAIYESKENAFEHAHELIDAAIAIHAHPHFLNTKGTIWLREAVIEADKDRAEYLLKEGSELIRQRIAHDSYKEVHYHSLIDKLLDWSKKAYLSEEQRLRILEIIQDDLDNALRLYPGSSELNTLAAKHNVVLKQIPNAIDKLRMSIKLNEGNVRARLMLAQLLFDNNAFPDALEIVENGLQYGRKSAGLYRLRLRCYRKLNKSWSEIKIAFADYLRLVESDYQTRVLYAKYLIEEGDREGAYRQIVYVKNLDIPFSYLINTQYELFKDGKPIIVEGTYRSVRLGKGFVYLDGYPNKLNAFLKSVPQSGGSSVYEGKRMRCRIGINGHGIVVLEVL